MSWIQLKINSIASNAEPLSEILQQCGALSVTLLDRDDTPIFEPLPGKTPLWDNTCVCGLFDANTDIVTTVVAVLERHPLFAGHFAYHTEILQDKDWEREWMVNFHPMKFGNRLWICPGWCEVPDPQAVNVMLDPGLAFGTGTHPTTALCLQWLDSLDLTGKTLIDYGCGSGILAIAALKLGATQVIGIDIDPQAIQASEDNAQRNGVQSHLALYLADQQPPALQADIVIANILAEPLRELAPSISTLVKPGGGIGLSGILTRQASTVLNAYQPWFSLHPISEQEEWCRISGIKR